MEEMTPTIVVLIGLAMRIGIPVIVTVIAVIILRKVDARWQKEAEAEPPAMIVDKPQCWEVNECEPAAMQECPAPTSPEPCWQVHRQRNGYLLDKCLTCQVFSMAPMPTPVHPPAHKHAHSHA